MDFEELKDKIEGITNDFESGLSAKSETNVAILELILFYLEKQANIKLKPLD